MLRQPAVICYGDFKNKTLHELRLFKIYSDNVLLQTDKSF